MLKVEIGVIGGSGLYQMKQLQDVEEIEVETPLGLRQINLWLELCMEKRWLFFPVMAKIILLTPLKLIIEPISMLSKSWVLNG